jgi:hypothetical protein
MIADYYRFLGEFTPKSKKREVDLLIKEGTKYYE